MRVFGRVLSALTVASCICLLTTAAPCETDQATAARIVGPQWKTLARRAGIVFAGTVVGGAQQSTATERTIPAQQLTFRLDQAIAGVESAQTLTIRLWSGALSQLRPMRPGERFLLFLYRPSRLGLTSPVGGVQGQIRLSHADMSADAKVLEQLRRAIRSARGE